MDKENNEYLKNAQDLNLHTEKEEIQGKPNAYRNIFSNNNVKKNEQEKRTR